MEEKITGLVVRDEDGKLIVLSHPTLGKGEHSWFTANDALLDNDNVRAILHHSLFPQVKWGDKENMIQYEGNEHLVGKTGNPK